MKWTQEQRDTAINDVKNVHGSSAKNIAEAVAISIELALQRNELLELARAIAALDSSPLCKDNVPMAIRQLAYAAIAKAGSL